SASTQEDTFVDVDLRTLASDVETPADSLAFSVGGAVHGTVSLLEDGHTARFTPAANYNGSAAAFTYSVTDTGDGASSPITTGPASVSISVSAVNDAPDAVNDTATAYRNHALTINGLANDTDVEGDALSLTAVT